MIHSRPDNAKVNKQSRFGFIRIELLVARLIHTCGVLVFFFFFFFFWFWIDNQSSWWLTSQFEWRSMFLFPRPRQLSTFGKSTKTATRLFTFIISGLQIRKKSKVRFSWRVISLKEFEYVTFDFIFKNILFRL